MDVASGRLEGTVDLPRHCDVLRVFNLLADQLPPQPKPLRTEEDKSSYLINLETNIGQLETQHEEEEDIQTLYTKLVNIINTSLVRNSKNKESITIHKILSESTRTLLTRRTELLKTKQKSKEMKEELSRLFKATSRAIDKDYKNHRNKIIETSLKEYRSTKKTDHAQKLDYKLKNKIRRNQDRSLSPEARAALAPRPQHRRQLQTFDLALRCLTHVLHLLLRTARDDRQRDQTEAGARRVVLLGLRSGQTGDSLLHLAASSLNTVHTALAARGLAPQRSPRVFPSEHVLVEALLAGGAHLDQLNKFSNSAGELLALNRAARVCPARHTPLACLAARALLAACPRDLPAPVRAALPATLMDFLMLHREPAA
ncbi:unnamed protein product [Leptidea sinapis]|uniref:Uncharacterized protein n=1 Tax=Leptidea sinapis TaxID=189913 RepID=A0A5E4PPY3_9NEOP|nr:unnamed protein product [Leptidea sinapis]